MLRKITDILAVSAVLASLLVAGCATRTIQPDGSVVVQEVDTDAIKLMATASVAVWAASQKDGIKPEDAENLLSILNAVEVYHADGSPIKPEKWVSAIQKQVPKRYQALAMVLVELVAHELDKRGLSDVAPALSSDAQKILRAIHEGALVGLRPYLPA
jgi:hypothetical protein